MKNNPSLCCDVPNVPTKTLPEQNGQRKDSRRHMGFTARWLWTAALVLSALACGGDDDDAGANNGLTCGDGTVEKNGQCVPGGECGEGTHSEGGKCVANGGNAGASGSGGSGGSSGSSGAGGSNTGGSAGNGGSAGTAGVAGQSGAGGTGAAGAGGTAGTTGGAGAGGSGAQGGSGNLQPGDEPCPAEPFLNCSVSCGEYNEALCAGTCFTPDEMDWPLLDFPSVTFPFTLRTPSHPGIDPKCVEECGADDTVYGFRFKINFPFTPDPNGHSPLNLRFSVQPPWIISADGSFTTGSVGSSYPGFCASGFSPYKSGSECVKEVADPPTVFYVVTLDPNAPTRNITIDLIPWDQECPP